MTLPFRLPRMSEDLKCRICGAPATIHLTQIINGKMKKIHLCEKCASKHNANELPLIKFAEMITKKLFGEKLGGEILSGNVTSFSKKDVKLGKKCSKCGLSENELEKNERLGCPQCYETFENELNAILPKIQHADAVPEASIPSVLKTASEKRVPDAPTVEELKKLLDEAVAREDYLHAATLRDQIANFKQQKKAKPPRKKTENSTKKASRKKPETSHESESRKKKKQ